MHVTNHNLLDITNHNLIDKIHSHIATDVHIDVMSDILCCMRDIQPDIEKETSGHKNSLSKAQFAHCVNRIT